MVKSKINIKSWIVFTSILALLPIAVPVISCEVMLIPSITLLIDFVLLRYEEKGRSLVTASLKLTHRIAYTIAILAVVLVLIFGVELPVRWLTYPFLFVFYAGIARANSSAVNEVSNRELVRTLAMLTPFAQFLHLLYAFIHNS